MSWLLSHYPKTWRGVLMRLSYQSRAALGFGFGFQMLHATTSGHCLPQGQQAHPALGEDCVEHPEGKCMTEKEFAILQWYKLTQWIALSENTKE